MIIIMTIVEISNHSIENFHLTKVKSIMVYAVSYPYRNEKIEV